MSARPLWIFGFLAALLFVGGVQAQSGLDSLAKLVQSGRYEAAYSEAQALRDEWEGVSRFDYYYGIAAIDAGHPAEGVFALERALAEFPSRDRVRVELARGYFKLGEDRRAREEFEAVLADDPPPEVRERIQRFLAAIRSRAHQYKTLLTGFAELQGGYDSNVNSGPEIKEIGILGGLFQLELDSDTRAQEDLFGQMRAGLKLRRPLAPEVGGFLALNASQRFNESVSGYDLGSYQARLGVTAEEGDNRLRWTIRTGHLRVDDEAYQDSYGAGFELRHSVSKSSQLKEFGRVLVREFPHQSLRDSTTTLLGVGYAHEWTRPSWKPRAELDLFGGWEDAHQGDAAASAVAERAITGVRLNTRFRIRPRWRLIIGGELRRSQYEGENLLFGRSRDEELRQGHLGIQWQPAMQWMSEVRYQRMDKKANIDLYEYNRDQAFLRIRYKFF